MSKDLVVIGGGPGGYVAAIRAGQLGADVTMVDDLEQPGGVCLNWGCIPTKTLLYLAQQYEFMQSAGEYGFQIDGIEVDWPTVVERSRTVVDQLGKGVVGLLKKNGVEYVNDRARLKGPGEVQVEDRTIETENVILATGAQPRSFPGIEPNGDRIVTSKEAMVLEERPEHLIVLGAGAIGMEFAYLYHAFGSEVTVVEMEEQLLPQEDAEVSAELESIYEKKGMNLRTGSAVASVEQEGEDVAVELQSGDRIEGDVSLVALGLTPNTEDLWNPDLNLRTDDAGWIQVKDNHATSLPGVYAIGDVAGAPWLAHVASHEGISAVEHIVEGSEPHATDVYPAVTFCQPQVASVGLTEEDARSRHDEVRVGKFPFKALGKALATDHTEGFVKLLFAGEYEELVGAHIIGYGAADMIAELGLAENLEATPAELYETIHTHPTLSEAVMEAALDAHDRVIHY